jgi:hypothetical protein
LHRLADRGNRSAVTGKVQDALGTAMRLDTTVRFGACTLLLAAGEGPSGAAPGARVRAGGDEDVLPAEPEIGGSLAAIRAVRGR